MLRFLTAGESHGPALTVIVEGLPAGVPVDPTANFPSRVIADKAPLHLPDWSAVEIPPHERPIFERGVRSSLMLPLLRESECVGVLALVRRTPGAFSDVEVATAKAFFESPATERARQFLERYR